MDKREFSIKVEQMEKQAERGDYETAMKIADKIDWRRVPNVVQLTRVAEIYEKNGEYREAREILLLAFERAPMARGILVHLIELALMEHDSAVAEKYYREFLDLAPGDSRQYVLRYSILKEKGAAAVQKIPPLERYISEELDEERMYELAELYHEAGRHAECVELCDRIAVMFGTGQWVEKALLLKMEREEQPLTEYQQNLLDNREAYEAQLEAMEENYQSRDAAAEDAEPQSAEELSEEPVHSVVSEAAEEETAGFRVEVDDVEKPAVQDEIDAEIEAHLEKLEAERSEMLRDARQNEAAAAVVRAERARAELGAEGERVGVADQAAQTEVSDVAEEVLEGKKFEASGENILENLPEAAVEEGAEKIAEGTAVETMPDYSADIEPVKSEKAADVSEPTEADDITRVLPDIRKALEEKTAAEDMGETKILPRLKNGGMERKTEAASGETAEEVMRTVADTVQTPQTTQPEEKPKAAEQTETEDQAELPGTFNCCIEGKTAEEGLNAAISRLKEIHAATGIRNTAAKIKAGRLNTRGVQNSAEKIAGKDLIIEEAGDLSSESISELLALIAADGGKRTVLLVDNPLQLSRLTEQYPSLAAAFCRESNTTEAGMRTQGQSSDAEVETRVETSEQERRTEEAQIEEKAENRQQSAAERAYEEEALDIDAFAHYASDYAKKIDCVITGKSMLALYERIEIMQEDGVRLSRKNAEALIEEVADRAEKPPLLKRIGGLFSHKYDKEGMLILKEDDFIS